MQERRCSRQLVPAVGFHKYMYCANSLLPSCELDRSSATASSFQGRTCSSSVFQTRSCKIGIQYLTTPCCNDKRTPSRTKSRFITIITSQRLTDLENIYSMLDCSTATTKALTPVLAAGDNQLYSADTGQELESSVYIIPAQLLALSKPW